jgi:hypothetical protein
MGIVKQFFSRIKVDKNLDFNVFSIVDTISNQEIESKINLIKKGGLSETDTLTLIEKIPEVFLFNDEEISKHLSFIYNSDSLYAVLFCTENNYIWLNYNKNNHTFGEKRTAAFNYKSVGIEEDSIIRNLIISTYRNDIIRSAQIGQNDSLQNRIYKVKQLKINSNGYRIL